MTIELQRSPLIVRSKINEAQNTLHDLADYVVKNHRAIDITRVQLLASKVSLALDAARYELSDATCDAEAALGRM